MEAKDGSGSVPFTALACNVTDIYDYSVVVRCQGTTEEARSLVYGGVTKGCEGGTGMSLERICKGEDAASTTIRAAATGSSCRSLMTWDVRPTTTSDICVAYPLDGQEGSSLTGSGATTTGNLTTPESCLWPVDEGSPSAANSKLARPHQFSVLTLVLLIVSRKHI